MTTFDSVAPGSAAAAEGGAVSGVGAPRAAPALGAVLGGAASVGLGRTVPVRGSSCAHPRSVRSPCGRSALRFVFIRTLHEHVRVRRARSRSGTLPMFRRRSNEDRARPRRALGRSWPGGRPRLPRASTTVTGRSIGRLEAAHHGNPPDCAAIRQYYWQRDAQAAPGADSHRLAPVLLASGRGWRPASRSDPPDERRYGKRSDPASIRAPGTMPPSPGGRVAPRTRTTGGGRGLAAGRSAGGAERSGA